MARIAFPVYRPNFLKSLGPVIDECLKRQHQVVLIYSQDTFQGHESALKCFLHGTPQLLALHSHSELSGLVQSHADVLVNHAGWPHNKDSVAEAVRTQFTQVQQSGIPQVALQSHFFDHCLSPLDDYEKFTKSCVTSPYSLEANKEILLRSSQLSGKALEEFEQKIDQTFQERVVVTGSPLFDAFKKVYEANTNPDASKDNALLFVPKVDNHPYMQLIMTQYPRSLCLMRSVLQYQGHYFRDVLKTPRFHEGLQPILDQCQKQQIGIISKSRPKHGWHYHSFLKRNSQSFLSGSEDVFYPNFTSAELFKNTRFSLHWRTFSVLEAVLAGVPSIHFQIPIADPYAKMSLTMKTYIDVVRGAQDKTLFNYPGCVWNVQWADAPNFLRNQDLTQLQQDVASRQRYIEYFCGISQKTATARQVDVIESVL